MEICLQCLYLITLEVWNCGNVPPLSLSVNTGSVEMCRNLLLNQEPFVDLVLAIDAGVKSFSSHRIPVIKFIILFVCLCLKLQSISIDSKSLLGALFVSSPFSA